MKIDHICFAVKSLPEGIEYWCNSFGYHQLTNTIINKLQKVKVVFLNKDASLLVKLIEPLPGNLSLQNFVNRGGGFHHICFRCADIEEEIKDLKSQGFKILAKPQPGEAFNDHHIAFLLGKYGMNVELIDTDEKAGIIGNNVKGQTTDEP